MKFFPRTMMALSALALMLFLGTARGSAQTQDSEQITQLLNEAKSHALDAESDAATLEAYTRSGLNWKSHAGKLNSMKVHVNELGKVAAEMSALEQEGSPWQQQAIRQVMPLLKEMAGNLTITIQHLNENQAHTRMSTFREYAGTNYELAKRTSDLIRDFVDYDEARSTAESLEQKLEIAQK